MRRRRLLIGAAAVVGATLVTIPLWSTPVLRLLPGFSVSEVEITGTHLLAAHEAYEALGITEGTSVWADFEPVMSALRTHPVVSEASLTRRLPGTLRLEVREERPVALLQDGVLRAISLEGVILPVDLARVPLDLPVVRPAALPAGLDAAESGLRPLLQSLERLEAGGDARVSEVVSVAADGHMRLSLDPGGSTVLMPADLSELRVARLNAVLGSRSVDEQPIEIDLRFRDQVVVRPATDGKR